MSKYTEAQAWFDQELWQDEHLRPMPDSLREDIDESLEIADRLEQADVHHHLDKIIELRTSPFTKDGDYHYIDGYNQALADIRGETNDRS